jgi:hypothetical protein
MMLRSLLADTAQYIHHATRFSFVIAQRKKKEIEREREREREIS